jgi:hypothetical protein
METKELLERAAIEIKSLRQENALMRARLQMFDSVMSALHGQPAQQSEGLMAPDIVYQIDKYLAGLNP